MTWKEFKDAVEGQGVKDEDEVNYLDCYPEQGIAVHLEGRPEGRRFSVSEV